MSITNVVRDCLTAGIPPLLIGSPGVGKTAILEQAAAAQGRACVTLHAPSLDSADVGGLHVPGAPIDGIRSLDRLLIGDIDRLMRTTDPMLLIIDEIGQAPPSVQAALSPLLYSRTIGDRRLPGCVAVAAATNRREDRAGAGQILTHLTSRCAVFEVSADLLSWTNWAIPSGVHQLVTGFLRWRSPLLHQFDPATGSRPYPCPRSWVMVSKMLHAVPSATTEHFVGLVGQAAATEFGAYVKIARDLPDVDALLMHPETIKKPGSASGCYALASAIAWRVTDPNRVGNVLAAATRLHKIGLGEYAAMLVRDCVARAPSIILLPAWADISSGPLAAALEA